MQWGGRAGGPCDWQNFPKASRLEDWATPPFDLGALS